MAINFIKNILDGNVDEITHNKFVRYGKGNFEKEEFTVKVGSRIQVQAGFEYVDILFKILSEVITEPVTLKGEVVSTTKIADVFANFGIEPKKITGKKYTIDEELSPEKFKDFMDVFGGYFLLLKASSGDNLISTKKSVPKPGKLVEKFVTAKFEKSFFDIIKKEFLFDCDVDKFKTASITHTYKINEIIFDEALVEKDPLKARLEAKRKGTIVRKIVIDGSEKVIESEATI
jgi:hypothetical protein